MESFYVLGIAGGSGSGKTTLVRHIREVVASEKISILALDAYYRDFSHLEQHERAEVNFDHPDSFEFDLLIRHIMELKRGRSIEMPVYDFRTHSRTEQFTRVEPHPVIIVEGIMLYAYRALRSQFDLKVFLDVPHDIRILRRIHRDLVERGRTLDSIMHQYQETVRPMHLEYVEPSKAFADILIPEGGENKAAQDILSIKIDSVLRRHDRLTGERQR